MMSNKEEHRSNQIHYSLSNETNSKNNVSDYTDAHRRVYNSQGNRRGKYNFS